jgi:hypothetical protein
MSSLRDISRLIFSYGTILILTVLLQHSKFLIQLQWLKYKTAAVSIAKFPVRNVMT